MNHPHLFACSSSLCLGFLTLLHLLSSSHSEAKIVFCGPSMGPQTCQSPSLQKPGLILTDEMLEGQQVCCGFPKPISGYSPVGKKEDSTLRKKSGRNNRMVCNNPIKVRISTGDEVPNCPPKTFYEDSKSQCCYYEKRARDEGRGRNASCVDLAAPGRPSDCPANKHRCDDPLWKDLMTAQCPKTCNRCALKGAGRGVQRGDVGVCRDGVGPNGVSECPENKQRCEESLWREFMRKECPKTCGVCGGGTASTRGRRSTTSRTTPQTIAPSPPPTVAPVLPAATQSG